MHPKCGPAVDLWITNTDYRDDERLLIAKVDIPPTKVALEPTDIPGQTRVGGVMQELTDEEVDKMLLVASLAVADIIGRDPVTQRSDRSLTFVATPKEVKRILDIDAIANVRLAGYVPPP